MEESIKILTLVSDLGRGGAQRIAQNFADLYHQLSFDSKVMVGKGGGFRESILKDNGIDVYSLNDLEFLNSWTPHIVHIHDNGIPDDLIQNLRDKLNESIFLELNTFSWPSSRRKYIDIQTHMTKWCLWKYQTECSIKHQSPGAFNIVLPHFNNEFLYYQEDESECNKLRKHLGIPASAIVFGRVGQKNKSKWSEVTLSSFMKVNQKMPDTYLVLIGCPDNLEELLKHKYSKIQDKVRLVEYRDSDKELRTFYSTVDIFLHTSWLGESFGFVLTESMLCQTPVVTLSTPYIDNSQVEVVGHRLGGLVAHSEQDFISSLLLLANDKQLRIQLGEGARIKVMEEYSITAVKEKVDYLIKSIYSKPRNEWQAYLSERFITRSNATAIIQILKTNQERIPPGIIVFIRLRVLIGKVLSVKYAWNFLFRNYLKLFWIRHL